MGVSQNGSHTNDAMLRKSPNNMENTKGPQKRLVVFSFFKESRFKGRKQKTFVGGPKDHRTRFTSTGFNS